MESIELTHEQKLIASKAIANVLTKKKQSFITGPAGCGKTTIANEIANILFENHGMDVYFTAPTHTAANRLQKVLSNGERQISVSTVHKFLGMRPVQNDYGKLTFEMSGETKPLTDKEILIVDEASMLSEDLYANISKICKHRVIFLGDSCQIPPSGEGDRFKLLTERDSTPPVKFYVEEIFELNKVHRQNNETALYNLCKFLRDSILDGSCLKLCNNKRLLLEKFQEYESWDDNTVFMDIPGHDVVPSILNINDTCFLGYGNPTVQSVQEHLPEWYVDGGYGITNSPVFKAVKIEGETKYVIQYPNNAHLNIINIEARAFKKWGIAFDKVKVSDEISEGDILVPSDQETFADDYQNWINIAKYNDGLGVKLTPRQLADYKEYGYGLIDKKTLNEFVSSVVTLREGRASTIHRAQGQQWNNCIIAFNNIMFAGVNTNEQYKFKDDHRKIIAMKLLYTAISRAKEKVVFCFETKKENYKPVYQ